MYVAFVRFPAIALSDLPYYSDSSWTFGHSLSAAKDRRNITANQHEKWIALPDSDTARSFSVSWLFGLNTRYTVFEKHI
jgi:hypothetical protein